MKRTDVGTSEYSSPQQTSMLIPTKKTFYLSVCLFGTSKAIWLHFHLLRKYLIDGGMVDISRVCIWAKVTSRLTYPQGAWAEGLLHNLLLSQSVCVPGLGFWNMIIFVE
jgi:hypothetical protein